MASRLKELEPETVDAVSSLERMTNIFCRLSGKESGGIVKAYWDCVLIHSF